mmetsp:Transcript_16701/g.53345  ORF Transcript_16701/g.53345 Transcript_16701/m.53345 type:complete len:271 (+) Transcript_16701:758-1570(+)
MEPSWLHPRCVTGCPSHSSPPSAMAPVAVRRHKRTAPSLEPVARRDPSGEKARHHTSSGCPWSTATRRCGIRAAPPLWRALSVKRLGCNALPAPAPAPATAPTLLPPPPRPRPTSSCSRVVATTTSGENSASNLAHKAVRPTSCPSHLANVASSDSERQNTRDDSSFTLCACSLLKGAIGAIDSRSTVNAVCRSPAARASMNCCSNTSRRGRWGATSSLNGTWGNLDSTAAQLPTMHALRISVTESGTALTPDSSSSARAAFAKPKPRSD